MNIDFKNLQDKYKALINNEATRNNAFKNSKKNLLEFSNNNPVVQWIKDLVVSLLWFGYICGESWIPGLGTLPAMGAAKTKTNT